MKVVFKANSLAVGLLLLFTAMGSAGLGLGRAQGAVFVGKPLDVRVQLQLDASEDIQSACMGADVFYGETPLDTGRVSVTVESAVAGSAKGTTVRVVSSVLIDEPIVTVNVRAGCEHKSSRRYTLFSEVSTSVVEPVVAAASAKPPVVLPKIALSPMPEDLAAVTPKIPRRVAGSGSAVAKRAPAAQAAAPVVAPVAVVVREKPAKAAGKSRLKLDSLDLLIERDPVLRASTELLTLPQENTEQRAAAAAQWRALNANPEDMLREAANTHNMERDLKALYAVTAENQKGLMDLVAKVQRAESERYANGLVYTLGALCLAGVVALAVLWRRLRLRTERPPRWLQGLDPGDSLVADLAQEPTQSHPTEPDPVVAPEPQAPPAVHPVQPVADPIEIDFDLDLMAPPSPVVSPDVPVRDRFLTAAGGLRAMDSEVLLDVRQQADFFTSLGEHQKAIDVLTTRIAQCGESSPLVCLDLLKIYHNLGRESEFAFMRTEFNAWFTGYVPEFSAFGDEGLSLDHYPQILNEIVALWPNAHVLEYIEHCLYHHASDADGPTFDLQAYRDLLLLHAIAKRIVRLPGDSVDSRASELMRIPAQAPGVVLADAPVHRAGAEHRGAWKRSPLTVADPQSDVETRGTPLGAMRVPPSTAPAQLPDALALGPDPDNDLGHETDFNFLSLH